MLGPTPNPSHPGQTITSQPDATKHQLPSSYWFELQSTTPKWLSPAIRRLNIGAKISLGYALALGIGVVGTTTGFLMGNYYHQQAEALKELAQKEIRLLYRLQTGIFQSRLHQQQLIPLTEKPEQLQKGYSGLVQRVTEVKQQWSEVKSFVENAKFTRSVHSQALLGFLKTYEGTPDAYLQLVKQLVQENDPGSKNSEDVDAAREELLNFTNSPVALKLEGISNELTELIRGLELDELQAEADSKAAAVLRVELIVLSILLSAAIASLLAMYSTRAIARPIQAVTDVAQRVTAESNFDLYVPVSSDDEMGVLADSLNQLIFKVRSLLDNLQAEKEAQVLHSEKMATVGRMVASVANEIKNPLNFIYGNLDPAKEDFEGILALLNTYAAELPKPPPSVRCLAEEIELDFLKDDLPKLLSSMKVGAKRARAIVLIMENFSRLDETKLLSVDLHKGLDSTLVILRKRLKNRIKVVRNYGDIPEIEGYTGLLYQVFMNVLNNAIEALEEKTADSEVKKIAIRTARLEGNWVEVRIADNGTGIALENQGKIFDTFFTTKQKGVGTGLGLAICRQIVVGKHGGRISCSSEVGKGSEFAIALPIEQEGSSGTFIQMPFSSSGDVGNWGLGEGEKEAQVGG